MCSGAFAVSLQAPPVGGLGDTFIGKEGLGHPRARGLLLPMVGPAAGRRRPAGPCGLLCPG
eukprot:9162652-Pyramimonas_sp.AAC.1